MKAENSKDLEIIGGLLEQVEKMCGRQMLSPRDFEWLNGQLLQMGEGLSVTTLKRCWGYVSSEVRPRLHTLDVLARFVGYGNYAHFVQSHGDGDAGDSSRPVLGEWLRPRVDLKVNDRVRLTWQPGRVCVIRYLGNEQFVVESSERTRLQPGNTFYCGVIIEGEPMFARDLVIDGRSPVGYECGKRGGVHYSVMGARDGES